jgi:hypothetical protein
MQKIVQIVLVVLVMVVYHSDHVGRSLLSTPMIN